MFYFYITGLPGKHNKVETYCENVLKHFFGNRIKRPVDIELRFEKNCKPAVGYCHGDHEHIVIEISKHDIDDVKLSRDDMMLTLAHELVHAKQLIRKEKINHSLSECEAYGIEQELFDLYWSKN